MNAGQFKVEVMGVEEAMGRMEEGEAWAEKVNTLFKTTSSIKLIRKKRVKFFGRSYQSNEYEKMVRGWMAKGASQQLVDMLDKNGPVEIPEFGCNICGEVWFDVNLTGNGCTKMARVSPHNVEEDDGVVYICVDPSYNDNDTMYCDGCGTGISETPLKKCARCEKVRYCSKECQKNEWKQHKHECKK
jgi:hypothetical protein